MKSSFVLLFTVTMTTSLLSSCQNHEGNIATQKHYVNLRHSKTDALFTCKTAQGESGTLRALQFGQDGVSLWKIEEFEHEDVKELANRYCEEKF